MKATDSVGNVEIADIAIEACLAANFKPVHGTVAWRALISASSETKSLMDAHDDDCAVVGWAVTRRRRSSQSGRKREEVWCMRVIVNVAAV